MQWLLDRVSGDTLHVGPRWPFHCGGLSVRGWRFHSVHSSTQRRLGRGSQSQGMSLEFVERLWYCSVIIIDS